MLPLVDLGTVDTLVASVEAGVAVAVVADAAHADADAAVAA